jgi:glutamate-1-semialdehyde 2,1-aminomutase
MYQEGATMNLFKKYMQQLHKEFAFTRPRSKELYAQAARYMPGGDTRTATFFNPFPHFIASGQGAFIFDEDGHKLLDMQNNYTSLIHGHAHQETVNVVREQIGKGSAYTSPMAWQIKLSELLTRRFPGIDLVRFANSGTEANMHALRAARAYTGKAKIVKTEGGYHGTTDVFEASVDPNLKQAGALDKIKVLPASLGVSENALKDVLVVPFNNIELTKAVIDRNYQEIAAVIVEPVMASAGQIVAEQAYLKFLREITEHYKIVLIFDEVVTGRLAMGGAQEHFGVLPDLTTLGKIIGGGIPIGAFGGKAQVMEIYDPRVRKMYHSGTFNGNAISMAAGYATMSSFAEKQVAAINMLGSYFQTQAQFCLQRAGLSCQIIGVGSIYNTIFGDSPIKSYRDVALTPEHLNELLFMKLLMQGVFIAPRGMFCLSTAMSKEEVDLAVARLEESLVWMRPVIEEVAPNLLAS